MRYFGAAISVCIVYSLYSLLMMFVVKMALYKAKKAGQTLAAQKKQEEVSKSLACLSLEAVGWLCGKVASIDFADSVLV